MKRPKAEVVGPNHIVIYVKGGKYLQSYDKIIAFVNEPREGESRKVYLDKEYWNFSKSTARHRNSFLGLSNSYVNDAVRNNVFIMKNLND